MKAIIITFWAFTSLLMGSELNILTEEFPPYNYKKDGEVKGASTAVVRAIQKKLNDTNKVTMSPWNRGYSLTLKKPNYALFSTSRLESRENLFQWVGPIGKIDSYLFKHKDSTFEVKTLNDAKKVKLISAGSSKDASYLILESKGFKNLSTLDTLASSIHLLLKKSVDLAAAGDVVVPLLLKKFNASSDSVINTNILVFSKPVYIAFSKKTDPAIVKKWQKALDELKTSGEYDKIIQKALKEAYKDFGALEN